MTLPAGVLVGMSGGRPPPAARRVWRGNIGTRREELGRPRCILMILRPVILLKASLLIGANFLGIWMYVLYGNIDIGTIVGGITAITGASVAMIAIVTPKLAEAIRVLGPALAELQKQREEIAKGSLSGRVELLQTDLKAMSDRVEDANQKLHEARNLMQSENLRHLEEVGRTKDMLQVLTEELRAARKEIDKLRMENMRLLRKTEKQIKENREGIESVKNLSDSALARLAERISMFEGGEDPDETAAPSDHGGGGDEGGGAGEQDIPSDRTPS